MSYAVVGIALTLLAVAVFAIRSAKRRAAAFDESLRAALTEQASTVLEITESSVTLASSRLPFARLRTAGRKYEDVETVARSAVELLHHPLSPLGGPLSLKIHGTRIGLHFVQPVVLDLLPSQPRLAARLERDLGLTATYRIDGRADGCLSEDHLREQAIDSTDVHGIALAVLRQHFDESLVDRLVSGSREVVESADGSASALILVLPDFLPPRIQVEAALEDENRLVLKLLGDDDAGTPSSSRCFLIDDQGWRLL